MKYSKKSIIFSFLVFGLFGLYGPHSVGAIEYGGLGVYPNISEFDEKNPLTRSWFIYELGQGEKIDIANISNKPVEIEVYPVDAVTTKDGAFAPEPEDKEKVGVGAWITLAESEFSLDPGQVRTIDFTVKVPEYAEVGDHIGAIIVQAKKPSEQVEGTGLRIATRVGARMYITIPGEIVKELEFKEFNHKIEEGTVTFYSVLANKGNARIRTKGEIEIINILGKVVTNLSIPEREVFPQKTITIPIEWNEASLLGKFTARASVIYGGNQVLSRELTFLVSPWGRVSLGMILGLLGAFIIVGSWSLIVIKGRSRKQNGL